MKQPTCVHCGSVVLEMEGQFEKLDSFYLTDGGPPPTSAGAWHSRCLHESPYGLAWYEARLRNFVDVRRYKLLATTEQWSVAQHPRATSTIALSRSGDLLSLNKPSGKLSAVEAGGVYRVIEDDFHLSLDNPGAILAVQADLSLRGESCLLSLLEAMGLNERISHPECLKGAKLIFNPSLQRYWSESNVSACWDYGVFIPAQLEPYVQLA